MTEQDTDRKRFSLRVSPALHAQLVALAEDEHRSLNEQIVWMLERQLEQTKRPEPGTTHE